MVKENEMGNILSIKEQEIRKNIKLTKIQEEVLVGGLLGDSCISRRNPLNVISLQNYYLKIKRAIKDIKYLEW